MSSRSYPKLPIEKFGRLLIATGDLDPIYIALNKCDWNECTKAAWLVAYFCCYHAGFACYMTSYDGPEFWRVLRLAAANTSEAPIGGRWPRAAERRHWRGVNALKSVEDLTSRYPAGPIDMINYLSSRRLSTAEQRWGTEALDTLPYGLIAHRVQQHSAFGSWMSYKVGDMLERCCGVPVTFERDDAMYDSPRKVALEVWKLKAGITPLAKVKDEATAVGEVLDHLMEALSDLDAPGGGRRVGYTECETVLCKFKPHSEGRYAVGHDIAEIRSGLTPWVEVSGAAREFLGNIPELP